MAQSRVRVVLRVRPNMQDIPTDGLTIVDGDQVATVLLRKRGGVPGDLLKFTYSRALEGATQDETYKICGEEIVSAALEGYNATILAYGQTGSGKTYTMLGPEEYNIGDPDFKGIMPRALDQVFGELRRGKFVSWTVKLTYIEIYNESFRDLLEPRATDISLVDSNPRGRGTMSLRGIQYMEVQSVTEALHYLRKGQLARHVASHTMNDRSSRSHTILTLWIETTDAKGSILQSKLNLVDLSGSERIRKTGAVGHLAREAAYINKSLTSLAMVVTDLRKKAGYVSYRNSKLTHFLKDGLGGNCRTLLVACVWGEERYLDETMSTCRFADDIQKVEVNAEKNNGIESIHGHLFRLDAPILKYIDQVTARRVAQEKAKLMRELKRRGHLGLQGVEDVDAQEMTEDEYQELEELRARVKELETIQQMLNPEGERAGTWDNELKETEQLRMRVRELELERERDAQRDAWLTERGMSLMSEMEALRERIKELQEARSLSVSEGLEGSPESQGHLDKDGSQIPEPVLEREVKKLEELQSHLKKLQRAGSIDDKGLLELLDLRDKILNANLSEGDVYERDGEASRFIPCRKKCIKGSALPTVQDEDIDGMSVGSMPNSCPPLDNDGYHRMGSTRDLTTEQEIQMLREQNEHMRQALESYADLPSFNHHATTNGFEHAYMETVRPESSISYSHEHDGLPQHQPSGYQGKSSGNLKRKIGRKLGRAFSWRKRDKINKFLMDYQTTEDEDVPNIVILNSLTHDQLLELLKARHAQNNDARDGNGMRDVENGSQFGTSQSVRSMGSSGMDTSTTVWMETSGAVDPDRYDSIRDLEVV